MAILTTNFAMNNLVLARGASMGFVGEPIAPFDRIGRAVDGWSDFPDPKLASVENRFVRGVTLAGSLMFATLLSGDVPQHSTVSESSPPTGMARLVTLAEGPRDAGTLYTEGPAYSAEQLRIRDYCLLHGINFQEAWDLASHIQPTRERRSLTQLDRDYALAIAVILIEIRHNDSSPFYTQYRDFIDTVIRYIRGDSLRIDTETSSAPRSAVYTCQLDTLNIRQAIVLESELDRVFILHELFHFYQDARGEWLSYLQGEVDAEIMSATYMLMSQGLHREATSREQLETYISSSTAILRRQYGGAPAHAPSLRLVYARLHNEDTAELQTTLREQLRRSIVDARFTSAMTYRAPELIIYQRNAMSAVRQIRGVGDKLPIINQLNASIIRWRRDKNARLSDLRAMLDNTEFDQEATDRLYDDILQLWLAILWNTTLSNSLISHDNVDGISVDVIREFRQTNLVDLPLYEEMFNELIGLHYNSKISPVDGVELR